MMLIRKTVSPELKSIMRIGDGDRFAAAREFAAEGQDDHGIAVSDQPGFGQHGQRFDHRSG